MANASSRTSVPPGYLRSVSPESLSGASPCPSFKLDLAAAVPPMLVGDWVILCREGGEQSILAVDRKTGRTIWKESLRLGERWGGCGHSSPLPWKDQIVVHKFGEIVGLDLQTGKRRWWLRMPSQGNSTPVAGQEMIYVSGWTNFGEPDLLQKLPDFETVLMTSDLDKDGLLSEGEFPEGLAVSARIDAGDVPGAVMKIRKGWFRSFDEDKDGRVNREEWTKRVEAMGQVRRPHGLLAVRPNGEGELSEDAVVWRENRGVAEIPSPLFYHDKLYMVTNGGIVTCMDPTNGKTVFRSRLGAPGLYYSSPVRFGRQDLLRVRRGRRLGHLGRGRVGGSREERPGRADLCHAGSGGWQRLCPNVPASIFVRPVSRVAEAD